MRIKQAETNDLRAAINPSSLVITGLLIILEFQISWTIFADYQL